jgi:hypothetical protein
LHSEHVKPGGRETGDQIRWSAASQVRPPVTPAAIRIKISEQQDSVVVAPPLAKLAVADLEGNRESRAGRDLEARRLDPEIVSLRRHCEQHQTQTGELALHEFSFVGAITLIRRGYVARVEAN